MRAGGRGPCYLRLGSRRGFLRAGNVLSVKPWAAPSGGQDSGGLDTHCAVGVRPPDRGLKRALQKEILGNDKEAGQHAEAAGSVCCQAQHLLRAENHRADCCPKVRDSIQVLHLGLPAPRSVILGRTARL